MKRVSDKENCKGAILNGEKVTVAEKKLFHDTNFSSDSESDGSDAEDSSFMKNMRDTAYGHIHSYKN